MSGNDLCTNIFSKGFYDPSLLLLFINNNCKKFEISALNNCAYTAVNLHLFVSGDGLLKVETCSCWLYMKIQIVFDWYMYWFIILTHWDESCEDRYII